MVGKTAATVGLATAQGAAGATMMVRETAANVGLATAASTMMLLMVLCVLTPWLYVEYFRKKRAGE